VLSREIRSAQNDKFEIISVTCSDETSPKFTLRASTEICQTEHSKAP
jgi:hypothetical protein